MQKGKEEKGPQGPQGRQEMKPITSVYLKSGLKNGDIHIRVPDKAQKITTGEFDGQRGVYIWRSYGKVFVPYSNIAEIGMEC